MSTPTPGPFNLYPEERHWWSFRDYQAVLDAMRKTKAKRVLEFGPGSSTLALIEGGAKSIDTCEDAPDWAEVYEQRLVARFPKVVRLHRYTFAKKLTIPAIDDARFDLAMIDGPLGTNRRPDVLRYALDRCRWVLMPTEEYHAKPFLGPIIQKFADKAKRPVEFWETGPLSGAFALVGPAE